MGRSQSSREVGETDSEVEKEARKDARRSGASATAGKHWSPPCDQGWTLEATATKPPRRLLQLLLFFVILASDSKP